MQNKQEPNLLGTKLPNAFGMFDMHGKRVGVVQWTGGDD